MKLFYASILAAVTLQAASTTAPTATPASLTYNYQLGAPKLPGAQTVALRYGTATPTFTAAVTSANSQWLTVTSANSALPASLSLYVNPTSLGVGTYPATVMVTVTGVTNPLTIAVTLNVTSAPPTLTANPATLTFTAPPTPVPTQAIVLATVGEIPYTVSAGATWLTVSPSAGVVTAAGPVTLTVTADPASLTPQASAYTAKITITAGTGSSAKAQTISVSLTLSSSQPTISSIWPSALPMGGTASQTITINGTNFYSATTASIQGVTTPLVIKVLSSTVIQAVVPAAQLATAGTLQIVVTNPAPGGASAPSPVTVGNVPSISLIANVASYATTSVSPGEIVTIFGSDIGPAQPAYMTSTNGLTVDTALGGFTVSIGSIPAPLLYASANQVTVQVPYEVTPGAGVAVVLTNPTDGPATYQLNVNATAPGLFTADGSGASGAAAVNVNQTTSAISLNTSTAPAYLGDTVELYLTGEGDYSPTLSPRTGLLIPPTMSPLPQMSPLPTVTIGGATATVNYAGPIVGSILGLLQINAIVPASATTGTAVPVSVTIGGVTTQSNVTLSVHQ